MESEAISKESMLRDPTNDTLNDVEKNNNIRILKESSKIERKEDI